MERIIKPRKCIAVGRIPDDDFLYGSFKDSDKLVDSANVEDRLRMARLGYGLDKLKDDVSPKVRLEVAKQGYYLQQFIKDSSPFVRYAARQHIVG